MATHLHSPTPHTPDQLQRSPLLPSLFESRITPIAESSASPSSSPRLPLVAPTPRSPSRSEMLLRTALLRDDFNLERSSNSTHRRRHSSAASAKTPSIYPRRARSPDLESVAVGSYLFCNGAVPSTPTRSRYYKGDAEFMIGGGSSCSSSGSRSSSVSSESRIPRYTGRATNSSAAAATSPRSPHEQVLRARLERVLSSAPSTPQDRKRASLPALPNSQLPDSPLTAYRSAENSSPLSAKHRTQLTSTTPALLLPPMSPLILQPRRGRSDPMSQTKTQASIHTPQTPRTPERSFMQQLTPPPTPPPPVIDVEHPVASTPEPRTPEPRRPSRLPPGAPNCSPFNVRTASAQCKQIEGYVSFAAVEGLGEPPEVESEERQRAEDESRRKRNSWTSWKLWPLSS